MSKGLIGNKVMVNALPCVSPSTSAPTYISVKNALHITVYINGLNGSTVTGSAIGLSQATAVAGTSAKTLAFDTVWRNIDTAAADGLAKTTVTSNTFTTVSTNSKAYIYVIEVDPASMDTSNSFDCFAVTTGNAVNTTLQVTYIVTPRELNSVGTPTLLTD